MPGGGRRRIRRHLVLSSVRKLWNPPALAVKMRGFGAADRYWGQRAAGMPGAKHIDSSNEAPGRLTLLIENDLPPGFTSDVKPSVLAGQLI